MSLLFIFRHSPYNGTCAKEGLEALMAAAAFEQCDSVIFTGEGVWQLLTQQNSASIARKNHEKMLKAMPLYGVEKLYVDEQSLLERQLDENQLALAVTLLSKNGISDVMAKHQKILSF